MGMLGQHLKRSGRSSVSSPPKTKPGTSVLHDTPKLNSTTTSCHGDNPKKVLWPHGSWNLLKPKSKASATQKTRHMKSSASYLNGNDDMIPTTEEAWNCEYEDEIALLAEPIPSFVEPLFSPSDEEDMMFPVISPLSANSFVSSSNPSSCSTQRSFHSPTLSTEKSPPLWKRVSIWKPNQKRPLKENSTLSCKKKKKLPKEEIEIQFECFFEEEDEHPEWFWDATDSSPTPPKATAALFRRTTVTQSWWTQTLGGWGRRSTRGGDEGIRAAGEMVADSDDARRRPEDGTLHPPECENTAPVQFPIPFHVADAWEECVQYFDAVDTSSAGAALV